MSAELIMIVFSLLVRFGLASAIGYHASSRDHNPYLWGFIVLLLGLSGVLVYVLVRLFGDN